MKLTKQLPAHANIDQLKRQAKELLAKWRSDLPEEAAEAQARVLAAHPRGAQLTQKVLADAQLVIAREYGFVTWAKLREKVKTLDPKTDPILAYAFTEVAVIDLHDHGQSDLERAEAIRAQHPDKIGKDIFTAAIVGDEKTLADILAKDPSAATDAGGLYDWDPLTYLAFSKYLRKKDASEGAGARFVACAKLLLDHGASAHTGFYWQEHSPDPTLESAIYGVAGIAQNVELTKLLLERGADPNDEETAYHVSETHQNDVVRVLLDSGKLDERSLTTILHRKLDWHDMEGVRLALDHGADPNRVSPWGRVALEHSLSRYNAMPFLDLLLERGANPRLRPDVFATAARQGRGDALRRFGVAADDLEDDPAERLIAACALDDQEAIKKYGAASPTSILKEHAGVLLCQFAGIGNTKGVTNLLDLGLDVNAIWQEGFGYLEVAPQSMALHVASWCGRHETVALLIKRGATIDAPDGRGRTPLTLAARACTASWWTDRRSPDSVKALLAAGANPSRVTPKDAPPGYEEVDRLLGREK